MPFLTSGRSRFIGGGRVPPAPVPVAGSELLANGGFATDTIWSKGAGWLIDGGVAHCDAPTSTNLAQSVTVNIPNFYRVYFDMISVTAGKLESAPGLSPALGIAHSVAGGALDTMLVTAKAADYLFLYATGFVGSIDNVSMKILTLSSLISTRPYASADCDISVAITRTAGTQAGISARVDSAATPANFLLAYLDGAGNVKLDTCKAGVYANVAGASGAVTYGAGRILRLVVSGTSVSVYYHGTQVGTTQTVTDAGIDGNKNHGLFSTYAANTFTGYVAA